MWINCLHLSPFHHLLFSFPPTAVQLSSLSFPFNCLYQSYYHSLSCQGQWCVIISGEPSAAVFITADLFSPSKNTFFSWLPQHHTFLSFAFLFQLTESFFSFAVLNPHPSRLMCPRAWCSHLYLYSHWVGRWDFLVTGCGSWGQAWVQHWPSWCSLHCRRGSVLRGQDQMRPSHVDEVVMPSAVWPRG